MSPHFDALSLFAIAVGRRDAALAGFAAIAIAAGTHRAAGFAPEETSVAENAIEARSLRLALHGGRARHDHREDAVGNVPAARDGSGDLQIPQSGLGA